MTYNSWCTVVKAHAALSEKTGDEVSVCDCVNAAVESDSIYCVADD